MHNKTEKSKRINLFLFVGIASYDTGRVFASCNWQKPLQIKNANTPYILCKKAADGTGSRRNVKAFVFSKREKMSMKNVPLLFYLICFNSIPNYSFDIRFYLRFIRVLQRNYKLLRGK